MNVIVVNSLGLNPSGNSVQFIWTSLSHAKVAIIGLNTISENVPNWDLEIHFLNRQCVHIGQTECSATEDQV